MKTSLLICATCLVVTGCSAQLRFPSLSSALSSLTGFGSSSNSGSSSSNGQSSSSSSPYSGLVRDYGRNLMMAMSSIYPSIFKPPQPQQSAPQQQPQSPFEQFAASQPLQSLFQAATGQSSQPGSQASSGPSFSFGGSTFSISPSLPFGSMATPSQQQPQNSHSPFSASFGSSINSPPSFGPLSSAPIFGNSAAQSMPSFAPATSYNAAFDAANGGPSSFGSPPQPSFHSAIGSQSAAQQSLNSPFNQPSLGSQFNSQPFDSSAGSLLSPSVHQSTGGFGAPSHSFGSMSGLSGSPLGASSQSGSLSQQAPQAAASAPQPTQVGQQQFGQHHHSASQQYRPDMMSIAASAPVPSSNSYSNYGNIPSGPSQQAPASSSYQQPSYR